MGAAATVRAVAAANISADNFLMGLSFLFVT